MNFPNAKVKSVKADIAAGEIRISFSLPLNEDNLEAASRLALFVEKDAGKVEVSVVPNQPFIPGLIAEKALPEAVEGGSNANE